MSIDDNYIMQSIQDELIKSMQDTSESINIKSDNGIVSLSGCVNVLFEKNRAEEIAYRVHGVREVRNNITISLDGERSDKELEAKANKILRECNFSERLLSVTAKVSGGSVLLIGRAETERDRQLAISEASKTYGITAVVSDIKLSVFQNDVSLTNDINMALMQSKINVNDISAPVVRGKVTLTGFVEKEEDIDALVTLVQSVRGVEAVSNKLKIRKVPSGIV